MTQKVRKCLVCGDPLEGNQRKYCGKNSCHYIMNKPYYLKYQKQRRDSLKITRYCMVCGKRLVGRQKKYCEKHKFTKNYYFKDYMIKDYAVMPQVVPEFDNKCVECGGEVIQKDGEFFCKKCGLVIE